MRRGRSGIVAGALVACIAAALAGLGAARVPTAAPAALCIPIIMPCSSPTPTPTPTPTGTGIPGVPTLPIPGAPGAPTAPGSPTPTPTTPTAPATPAGPDATAPVFTQPPAQLGSSSLSFSGLKGISVVTVPLADGSRVPVLKISADSITIDHFSLTVRKETGPKLATTADQMALRGNVQVYLDSVTATGPDGKTLTLGAATPPPADGLPPQLLRVTLGLVGVTADSIHFTNPHQHLTE
ncbi:hypothetical protein SAMN04515691_1172 [Leifsonia sp. 98AMF]|uniref:hypothetical protein n=1 Tax=unclassified Leifsonia TaxID=2663824 RepID=UPI00087D8DAE|nr:MULTISPECIES: hypothetical protein [unclassified Leifsonia]SDH51065.1 hypothetical protein SAMN04515690_2848 [Leifsonia sp. 197AMF]SDI87055.1 hypothetical protein SAMN04515684_0939 [Leifsonia sp. 466MF]SDJ94749.1 hypothetical protein SAMN04515683_1810 [Leifsonia sp. 157MF]SDN90495.1 hypothetical protein SAMN04515686_3141 [Leifsonia sp. 509MF]SEN15482.1 hypothetical protein SAMN04515685_1794 [Leifsonia sp. 467MF]